MATRRTTITHSPRPASAADATEASTEAAAQAQAGNGRDVQTGVGQAPTDPR